MFCFQIVTKQIDEFLLTELFSIRSADWILYPSYKHVNVTISPHIHVKQTTAVLINTLFCVCFFFHLRFRLLLPLSFSLLPPPTQSFFSKAKQLISMSNHMHCMSPSILLSKGEKKSTEKKKRGIKCEHAYTVWKKKKIIFYIHALIFLSLSSYVSRPQVNICP